MNKTINIHLAQTLYSLDEKAYIILKKYLDDLAILFANTEGGKDILDDIEARISELFTEMKKDSQYVFSVEDVEKVIATLGRPEELIDEEEPQKEKRKDTTRKNLFRDPDDRFIGGVAGGLSHYLGLESVWIRLILLILFFSSVGGVVLVYILLWILIPEAKTTADKLKMKGEPVNVSNIKRKIKEELNQVGETVKDIDYDSIGAQIKKKSRNFSDFLLSCIRVVGNILVLFIGILFLLLASLVLLGLLIGSIVGGFVSTLYLPHELVHFWMFTDIPMALIGFVALLLVGIPFVFLFVLGLHLLSKNTQIMGRTTRLVLLAVWVFALISIVVFGLYESKSFAVTAKKVSTHKSDTVSRDTLRLTLNDERSYSDRITIFDHITIIQDETGENLRLDEDLRLFIEQSPEDAVILKVEKVAKGWNQKNALATAELINYSFDFYDDRLMLDNFWTATAKQKNKPQNVRLTLQIPNGKYLSLGDEFRSLMAANIENDQDYYRKGIAGHLWKMSNEELLCQNCDGVEGELSISDQNFKMKISDEEGVLEVNIDDESLHIEKIKE